MRSIDADAILDKMRTVMDMQDLYLPVTFMDLVVDDMPTIEADPVNGWISVKDRLPENETEVLIYCPEFVCTIKMAMWIEDGFYVDNEDLIVKAAPNGYCTHWQHLPERPEEG